MRPGEKRLVLQSPQPTIEDALLDFPKEIIEQELQELNPAEYAQWGWSLVGPGATQKQLSSRFKRSHRFFKAHGCITIGSRKAISSATAGGEKKKASSKQVTAVCKPPVNGEQKCPPPYQGYAIIQNLDAGHTNDNGQSVYMKAPTVGNNQDTCITAVGLVFYNNCYSSFLNNVLTDKNYFLQAGFIFQGTPLGGKAHVVWTDTAQRLTAQEFPITYYANHTYWTTISFTNGLWWMCAVDIENTATYNCQTSSKRNIGTHLEKDPNTSIWVENFNKKSDWSKDFSSLWEIFGAKIYRDGIGQDWSSQDTRTADACKEKWTPENAILDSLVKGGYAYFIRSGLPTYCDPGGIAR